MASLASSSVQIARHMIPSHGPFPNTSLQPHPLSIYRAAFPTKPSPSAIEAHLTSLGVVTPRWRYPMYDFDHYHSTSHEVLVISHGSALLCFGGRSNPDRVEVEVMHGDAIIIPAGVSHSMIRDLTGNEDFEMVGSYPPGKDRDMWDMCIQTTEKELTAVVERIKGLTWFERDPIYGTEMRT